MDTNQMNFWLSINAANFSPEVLPVIKSRLEQMDDTQMMYLQSVSYKKPSTVFLIALLTGWERFFIDDIGLGIVKVITGYGCGIWWLIDIFSAKKRAMKYNFKQFQKATGMMSGGTINNIVPETVTPVTPVTPAAPVAPVNSGYSQPVNYQTANVNPTSTVTPPSDFYAPAVNQSSDLLPNLLNRIKQLLASPHTEYQAIKRENSSHTDVLTKYVLLLAIVPFLFAFIGGAIIYGDVWSYSFGSATVGVLRTVFYQLLVLFGGIYITSLIINSLANKYGGQSDFNRAFALVAYAYTPMFLAGVFHIWSGFSWLICTVGAYGLYLLVVGLNPMMKPADNKANSYSAVAFLVAVAVYAVLWKVLALIMLPDLGSSMLSFHYPY